MKLRINHHQQENQIPMVKVTLDCLKGGVHEKEIVLK